MKKILFLCTGNSCRSQMAEGFAQELGWNAFSAGTIPEIKINQNAIEVMHEIGIDISNNTSKDVSQYLHNSFFMVATVCDNARKACPTFLCKTDNIIHNSFIDPANASGTQEEILPIYRKVRDEIKYWVNQLLINK